jgi:hypothetical protein
MANHTVARKEMIRDLHTIVSNHSATSPLGGFSVEVPDSCIGHGILHAWLRNDFPRRRSPLRLSVTYRTAAADPSQSGGSQAA